MGYSLMMSGQIESSITFLQETVNLYPDVPLVHLTLGDALSTSGAFEEALRHYERAAEQTDRANLMYIMPLVFAYANLGRTEEARALLEELEEEYRESGEGALAGFAKCRAHLGEWDEAFEWYEEAFRKHNFVLSRLRNDADHFLPPDFVADPRFQDLLRRMNFPER